MLYAEYVETPLRQRPCRNISQYHRPMQQQTGIMLCLPGCLLLASPHDRTASVFNIDHCPGAIARQHHSSGLLWVSDSMGALTPPSVRGSPCHQSGGSVPAHNQVLTHGQRTWMALEKHAGRSTETIPRAWERNASHLVLELGGLREERGCRLPVEQREHFGQQSGRGGEGKRKWDENAGTKERTPSSRSALSALP